MEAREKGGLTALHEAAGTGKAEAVRELVEAWADMGARDEDGETPPHNLAKHKGILRLLEGR